MKIIDATWELRNLGKRTIELMPDKADLVLSAEEIFQQIEKIRKSYDAEYLVVKIRTENPLIGQELSKNGFSRIETQLHLKALREDVEIFLDRYSRFFGDSQLVDVTDPEDVNYVLNEIHKGIFYTDRIALDPEFGIKMANKRYANWVSDEVKRGGSLYYLLVNDKKVGFSLRKYNNSTAFSLLNGLFRDYQDLNIGGKLFFAEVANDIGRGCIKFLTDVSSNNIVSVRMHQLCGYRVDYLQDVYINHY